jgi:hypothetical protein
VEKDELVAKTKDEMMYFKREMLNREDNYNSKFNAKPVVGVMQVIKNKDGGELTSLISEAIFNISFFFTSNYLLCMYR